MLSTRRTWVHAPLLAAFLGAAMLLCGVAVAVVGRVETAVDDGARAVASQHAGEDLALRLSLLLPSDPARQDEQVRAALTRSLASVTTAVDVDRTISGEVVATRPGRGPRAGEERAVTALSVPDLPARAELVDGAWAASADDVVVQADAARELRLRPGRDVVLGGVRLHVTGTWRASDHLDPRWLGDTQVAVGSAEGQFGPVVVDESRWPDLEAEPRARWTLVPDLDDLTAADLDALAVARTRLARDWTGHVDGIESLQVDGRLPEVAQEVGLRTDGLRSVEPVVLLLLAVVGLVTLAALARLFASTHAVELSLLWARGASSGALARGAAAETAGAAAAGGVIGTLAAAGAALLGQESPRAGTTLLAGATAVLTVAVAVGALMAAQVHRATGSHAWRGPTGRAGRLVGPGLVALVVGGAALAVWQLRSYGSPVTVDAAGAPSVDPVAVAAPAALLVAVVLLALLAFPAVAALAERRARGDDVTRVLAARHLARRLVPVTAPVLVVAIAAAALVGAATYAGTWAGGFETTRQLRAGADLRVATGEPGPDSATVDAVAELGGVRAVAPVAIQLGGDLGSLLAVSPAALDRLARGFADDRDRDRVVAALTSRTSAPELPSGTTRVGLVLESRGLSAPPRATITVADATGALRTLVLDPDAGETGRPGTYSYSAPLPADTSGIAGARTVAAVDLDVPPASRASANEARIGLVSVVATGPDGATPLEDDAWTGQRPGGDELALAPGPDAPSGDVVLDPGALAVRFTPSFAPGSPGGPLVPIVLSSTTAQRLDLAVGDTLDVSLDGTYEQLHTEVSAVVAAVPGAPEETAALVDLKAVDQARLYDQEVVPAPSVLWVETPEPAAVATRLRDLLPANSRIDTAADAAGRAVLATGAATWWWGAAGCGLLALLALDTVARGQLRSRRGDVAVLRALGLSTRGQQLLRGRELAWTVAYGLVAGVVAGVAVAVLVVPQLARAAVPEPYPTIGTGLGVDLAGLLGGGVLLVAGLVAGIAAYARRVGRDARGSAGPVDER